MIIFKADGRLGNQIFQYLFIRQFYKKKRAFLITFNFHQFKKLFSTRDFICDIHDPRIIKFFERWVLPLIEKLCENRIFSEVKINQDKIGQYVVEGRDFEYYKGLLPITFVRQGYFQSEKMFRKQDLENISIKKCYLNEAQDFLDIIPDGYQKVFVHIRHGDYVKVDHYILGLHDFRLPLSYYNNSIKQFKKKLKKPWFVFLSDDIDYVEKTFDYIRNKTISKNDMYVDFAIMVLCDYGIIGNSSFSWWGGYLNKFEDCNRIIAPKYFLGFNNKIEYPLDILSCYKKQVDVNI